MNKPTAEEYAPFYGTYMKMVGDGDDVLTLLEEQCAGSYALFSSLSDEQANYAYAEGKWTIKQVLGHMIDAERTFAYRILAFSRGQKELPGFDENEYVERATFNDRSITDLAAEFKKVRESNLYLLQALTPEQLNATGIANGNQISVLAIVYIMAGHELHHIKIVKERYLINA
jgi:uncharacterized damage-inducible protein DinB